MWSSRTDGPKALHPAAPKDLSVARLPGGDALHTLSTVHPDHSDYTDHALDVDVAAPARTWPAPTARAPTTVWIP